MASRGGAALSDVRQQQQVDVGLRKQLLASVASHRDQSQARRMLGRSDRTNASSTRRSTSAVRAARIR